ncbi:MAG: riboflavin synthase [bacterium]
MFSGIIEAVGKIRSIRVGENGARISVEAEDMLAGAKLGDSIAVNGACMTMVELKGSCFEVDVSPESLRLTNLGILRAGDGVNLERALALGDRLGGHMVTGHIDGLGKIRGRREEGDSIWLTVEAPPGVMRYVVFKGSVAVDGISLTVADCDEDSFSISVIPHTSAVTTLTAKKDGAPVNLEADLIGKYVEKLLSPHAEGRAGGGDITLDKLKEHGYA